ncbi:uncharacterized protein CTRU02_215091 [Colletotrichum truncatum]|uniref:Uncharacterized protein n=1 Tax=Colletotrichum truncatum TaxID=5467 RepID=A0ACC3YDI0_COLTU
MDRTYFPRSYQNNVGLVEAPSAERTASFVENHMHPALASAGATRYARKFAREMVQHGQFLVSEMQRHDINPQLESKHDRDLQYLRDNWPRGEWVPAHRRWDDWTNEIIVNNMVKFTKAYLQASPEIQEALGPLADQWERNKFLGEAHASWDDQITILGTENALAALRTRIAELQEQFRQAGEQEGEQGRSSSVEHLFRDGPTIGADDDGAPS